MPGGGQVRVIKPWNLAAETLIYCAFGLGTLLVIFAVPEIFRAGMYFAYDVASNAKVNTLQWPGWALGFLSYALSAVIFTGIIRYVALGEGPFWIPRPRLTLNYLATAMLLMVVATIAYSTTPSWLFVKLYQYFVVEIDLYDERSIQLWGTVYSAIGFFISAVLVALTYPALGFTAIHTRINARQLLRWHKNNFWRILILAVLLMSVCFALRRAYWWTLDFFAPGLTSDLYYLEHENLRSMVVQIVNLPMDFLFDIVPAVAIGLLYRVLKANSVDE